MSGPSGRPHQHARGECVDCLQGLNQANSIPISSKRNQSQICGPASDHHNTSPFHTPSVKSRQTKCKISQLILKCHITQALLKQTPAKDVSNNSLSSSHIQISNDEIYSQEFAFSCSDVYSQTTCFGRCLGQNSTLTQCATCRHCNLSTTYPLQLVLVSNITNLG